MKPKSPLPVILVSACDNATAEEFISELIDNEVSEAEDKGEANSSEAGAGRVWRLVNKYYSAEVMVRALGDSEPPLGQDERVEAHVAYLTPEECSTAESAVSCAERRAGGAAGRAAVRVAALRSAHDVLGAWAARARCEPVPLLHADGGLQRVRDALHAHVWPGLRRRDRAAPPLPTEDSEESSSCGEEEDNEGDEADVERGEQFAQMLASLWDRGAAAAGAGGGAALDDAERRERAEQMLAAFCHALGHRLDI